MSDADGPLPVRVAGVSDLPHIVELVESAYRGDASRAGWTTEADLLGGQRTDAAMVRALIVSPRDAVLVSSDHLDLLACCAVGERDGRVGLGMFAVRPTAQGAGVGAAMLRAAERYAADRWAAEEVELTVIAQRTELIAWYERHGYVRTGETRPFPYGDGRYGVPRRPDLRLLVLARRLD